MPNPLISTLTDNFDDNSTDASKWDLVFWREGANLSGATVAETGGAVAVTPLTGSVSGGGYTSKLAYDVTDDRAFIKINPSNTNDSCRFYVGTSNDQYYSFVLSRAGNSLNVQLRNGFNANLVTGAYPYAGPIWLSIRYQSSDNKWYFEIADASVASDPPAPGDWTLLGSRGSDFSPTAVKAGFGVSSVGSNLATDTFDGFNTATAGAAPATITGSASGTIALTGSASAVAALSASAAGSFALTGAAVGVVPLSATAAGTLDLTGSAAGALGTTITASASGSLGLTGSANATVAVSAAAAGEFALSGSGTASVAILASVSGSLALTGASVATTADNIAMGTASGTLDFGGTADVAVLIRASANDNLALVGSATASVAVAAGATGELPISGASRGGQHFSFPVPASRRVAGAHTSRTIAPALQERRARA